MKKPIIYIILIFIVVFGINFITSIAYPDSSITVINLVASIIFVIAFSIGVIKLIEMNKRKILILFLLGGFLSGMLNYIAYDLIILRGIATPLYCLFITPFFGFNLFLGVKFGLFSAIISVFYLIALIITILYRREKVEIS